MLRIFPLLFFVTTASAQIINTESKVPRIPLSSQKITVSDTVQALHRLFKNRRTSGALLLGGTGAAVVATNVALSNEGGLSSDGVSDAVVVSGIALLYTSPLWVIGTSQLVRFSKKKEQAIIDEFTTKHTLPRKIQRHLKPKLFTAR